MSIAGNRPFHSSEFPHSWLGDVAARDEEDHERSNSVFPVGRQPGADPRVGSLAEQLAVRLRRFSQDKKMTRKVDINEYQDLADCIRMDQVPASEIAEIFTDKSFYKWYKKKYFKNNK